MRIRPGLCWALTVLGALGLGGLFVDLTWLEPPRAKGYVFVLAFLTPLYLVGVLAYRQRPDLPISRLLVVNGGLWAGSHGIISVLYGLHTQGVDTAWLWPAYLVGGAALGAALVCAGILFALFPDGRYRYRYERATVRGLLATLVGIPVYAVTSPTLTADVDYDQVSVANPVAIPGLERLAEPSGAIIGLGGGGALFIGAVLLSVRYFRSPAETRRQIRWLLVVPLVATAVGAARSLGVSAGFAGRWWDLTTAVTEFTLLALVPTAIFIAIFRHRLLDVDVLIRKSLVYGALWALIAVGYFGAAAAVGIAGTDRLPVAMAVLFTIAATVLFQPARRWLERLADRWVFGRRLGGYAVLAQLGSALEASVDQDGFAQTLAEEIRRGLRVGWCRIALDMRSDGAIMRQVVASSGIDASDPAEPARRLDLRYGGERLGVIECGPKPDGAFTEDDDHVLTTLARQAALALRNVRLGAELATKLAVIGDQATELRASRARIVQAQDAERRRLERDLHDGAQQQLVALIAKLRLARNQAERQPAAVGATLAELQAEAAAALDDLLDLARGIHPPVLTDRGLLEAIETRAQALPIAVTMRLPARARRRRYAEEIEAAGYFVVSEGLTNVLKHAAADRAVVSVEERGGRLRIEVADDGIGVNGAVRTNGTGLINLADRIEAIGGSLQLTGTPGAGTTLRAELPAIRRGGPDG